MSITSETAAPDTARIDTARVDGLEHDEAVPDEPRDRPQRRRVAVATAGVVLAASLFGGGFLTGRALAPAATSGPTSGQLGGQPPALPDGTMPQGPTGQDPAGQDPTGQGAGGAAGTDDGSSTV